MTKKKEDKDLLAMCGEYAVASELCKNSFNASKPMAMQRVSAVEVVVFGLSRIVDVF